MQNFIKQSVVCFGVAILISLTGFVKSANAQSSGHHSFIPSGKSLFAVKFADSLYGWIVGEKGLILQTTDGGTTWKKQNSRVDGQVRKLHVVNRHDVWAVGDFIILHTTDGGNSWYNPNTTRSNQYDGVFFTDSKTGWLLPCSVNKLYMTTNAGFQWNEINVAPAVRLLTDLVYINTRTGWVTDDSGLVYATKNGGITWQNQNIGDGRGIYHVSFLNSSNGYVYGFGIYHTTNGGTTWNKQGYHERIQECWDFTANNERFRSKTLIEIRRISFPEENCGWALASDGGIFHTTNGGDTWLEQYMVDSTITQYINDMTFVTRTSGWIVAENGIILHTSDGGTTWERKLSEDNIDLQSHHRINIIGDESNSYNDSIRSISEITGDAEGWYRLPSFGLDSNAFDIKFTDANNGWAICNKHDQFDTPYYSTGSIFHTTDGGISWNPQLTNVEHGASFLSFVDSTHGWMLSGVGLYRTTDGGLHWSLYKMDEESGNQSRPDINAFSFINATTGWMIGEYNRQYWGENERVEYLGTILSTHDGGIMWRKLDYSGKSILKSVSFVDTKNGWVVGDNGTIVHTSNGGVTWQDQNSGTKVQLYRVFFTDTQNGWVVGKNEGSFDENIVFHTTNGGENWQQKAAGYENYISDIAFTDKMHGWTVGSFNLHTTDGGLTWKRLNGNARSVSMIDANNGWALGFDGQIFRFVKKQNSTNDPPVKKK